MEQTVKHVLLVEDNPAHATLIRPHLQDFIGLVIHWVRSAEEAFGTLAMAEAGDSQWIPDLVLLDLKLPGLAGSEILSHLKANDRFRRIPVVVLSTSENTSDVTAAYDSRANGYLVKSTDPDQMRQMLHNTVAYWCAWNRLPVAID